MSRLLFSSPGELELLLLSQLRSRSAQPHPRAAPPWRPPPPPATQRPCRSPSWARSSPLARLPGRPVSAGAAPSSATTPSGAPTRCSGQSSSPSPGSFSSASRRCFASGPSAPASQGPARSSPTPGSPTSYAPAATSPVGSRSPFHLITRSRNRVRFNLLVGVGYDGDWNIEFGASASSAVCSFFFCMGYLRCSGAYVPFGYCSIGDWM